MILYKNFNGKELIMQYAHNSGTVGIIILVCYIIGFILSIVSISFTIYQICEKRCKW